MLSLRKNFPERYFANPQTKNKVTKSRKQSTIKPTGSKNLAVIKSDYPKQTKKNAFMNKTLLEIPISTKSNRTLSRRYKKKLKQQYR